MPVAGASNHEELKLQQVVYSFGAVCGGVALTHACAGFGLGLNQHSNAVRGCIPRQIHSFLLHGTCSLFCEVSVELHSVYEFLSVAIAVR